MGVGGWDWEIRVIKEVAKVGSVILRLDLLERPLHNYLTSPIKRCHVSCPLTDFTHFPLNITADVKDEKQQQKTPKGPQNN